MARSSTIESLLFSRGRQFAGIVPDVTLEESAVDVLNITEHPVEYAAIGQHGANASIADHAFLSPTEVSCKFGWSQQMALLNSVFAGGLFTGISSLQLTYQRLLDLQASRQPFDLSTGKRSYTNMLIKSLTQQTDAGSENVLLVSIVFRQLLTAQVATAQLAAERQASPQQTASVQNLGTVAPIPAKQSVLRQLFGGQS